MGLGTKDGRQLRAALQPPRAPAAARPNTATMTAPSRRSPRLTAQCTPEVGALLLAAMIPPLVRSSRWSTTLHAAGSDAQA